MNSGIMDPAVAASKIRETPMQRIGKTEDMAAPCIFLASRAGSWMTGEIYAASGGRVLGVYGAGDSTVALVLMYRQSLSEVSSDLI